VFEELEEEGNTATKENIGYFLILK